MGRSINWNRAQRQKQKFAKGTDDIGGDISSYGSLVTAPPKLKKSRERLRQESEAAVAAFLAAGGKITTAPQSEGAPKRRCGRG